VADGNVANFVHDFLKALFLPGVVAWIRLGGDFLDKISAMLLIFVGVRRTTVSTIEMILAGGIFAKLLILKSRKIVRNQ
jgi:hypothetical protein